MEEYIQKIKDQLAISFKIKGRRILEQIDSVDDFAVKLCNQLKIKELNEGNKKLEQDIIDLTGKLEECQKHTPPPKKKKSKS